MATTKEQISAEQGRLDRLRAKISRLEQQRQAIPQQAVFDRAYRQRHDPAAGLGGLEEDLPLLPHGPTPTALPTWEQAKRRWRPVDSFAAAALAQAKSFAALVLVAIASCLLPLFWPTDAALITTIGYLIGAFALLVYLGPEIMEFRVRSAQASAWLLLLWPPAALYLFGLHAVLHDGWIRTLVWATALTLALALPWVTPSAAKRSAQLKAAGTCHPRLGQVWLPADAEAPTGPLAEVPRYIVLAADPVRDTYDVWSSLPNQVLTVNGSWFGMPTLSRTKVASPGERANADAVWVVHLRTAGHILQLLAGRYDTTALAALLERSRKTHLDNYARYVKLSTKLIDLRDQQARVEQWLSTARVPAPRTPAGRAAPSALPAPGQLWRADVPYQGGSDDEGRTHKDRPVLVLSVHGNKVEALYCTSQNRDGRDGFVAHDCSAWSSSKATTWIRCFEPLQLPLSAFMHRYTDLPDYDWKRVSAQVQAWKGKTPYKR